MKTQEQQTKILIEVAGLLAKGYDAEIETVIGKIKAKEETPLPENLQKILDGIKNTPIDEPEIYEMAKKVNSNELSIIDLVLKFLTEEELDNHSVDEVSYFAGKLKRKVESLKDEDGIFKSTPNTSTWQPPKPSLARKIDNILRDKTLDDNEREEKASKVLFESSTCIKENLTEWEIQLVKEQSKEAYRGYLNSFVGKR